MLANVRHSAQFQVAGQVDFNRHRLGDGVVQRQWVVHQTHAVAQALSAQQQRVARVVPCAQLACMQGAPPGAVLSAHIGQHRAVHRLAMFQRGGIALVGQQVDARDIGRRPSPQHGLHLGILLGRRGRAEIGIVKAHGQTPTCLQPLGDGLVLWHLLRRNALGELHIAHASLHRALGKLVVRLL